MSRPHSLGPSCSRGRRRCSHRRSTATGPRTGRPRPGSRAGNQVSLCAHAIAGHTSASSATHRIRLDMPFSRRSIPLERRRVKVRFSRCEVWEGRPRRRSSGRRARCLRGAVGSVELQTSRALHHIAAGADPRSAKLSSLRAPRPRGGHLRSRGPSGGGPRRGHGHHRLRGGRSGWRAARDPGHPRAVAGGATRPGPLRAAAPTAARPSGAGLKLSSGAAAARRGRSRAGRPSRPSGAGRPGSSSHTGRAAPRCRAARSGWSPWPAWRCRCRPTPGR